MAIQAADGSGGPQRKIIVINDQGQLTQVASQGKQSEVTQNYSLFSNQNNSSVNQSEFAAYASSAVENWHELTESDTIKHSNAEDYDYYYHAKYKEEIENDGEFTIEDMTKAYYFGENDVKDGLSINEDGFPVVDVKDWGAEKTGDQKEANDCLSRIMHNYGGVGLYNENYNKMVEEICRINGFSDANSITGEEGDIILPIPVFDEEGKNIIGFISPEENASGEELVEDPPADPLDPTTIPDEVANTLGLKIPEDESKITTNEDGSITYMDANGVSEITLKLNEDGTYTQEVVSNKGTDKEVIANKKVTQDGIKLEELYTYADGSTKNGITGHKFKTDASGNMTILDSDGKEVSQENYVNDFVNSLPQEVQDEINNFGVNAIINSDGSISYETDNGTYTYAKTGNGFSQTSPNTDNVQTTQYYKEGETAILYTPPVDNPEENPPTLTNEEFVAQSSVQAALKTAGFELIIRDTENAVDIETDGSKTFKATDAQGNEFAINIHVDENDNVTITHNKDENNMVGEELHTLKYSEDGVLLQEEITSVNDKGELTKVITVYNSNRTQESTTETHKGVYLQGPYGEPGIEVADEKGNVTYYNSSGKELNPAPTTYGNYSLTLPTVPGADKVLTPVTPAGEGGDVEPPADTNPDESYGYTLPEGDNWTNNQLTDALENITSLTNDQQEKVGQQIVKLVNAENSELTYTKLLELYPEAFKQDEVVGVIEDEIDKTLHELEDKELYNNLPTNMFIENIIDEHFDGKGNLVPAVNDLHRDSNQNTLAEYLKVCDDIKTYDNAIKKIQEEANDNEFVRDYKYVLLGKLDNEAYYYGLDNAIQAYEARKELYELEKNKNENIDKFNNLSPTEQLLLGDEYTNLSYDILGYSKTTLEWMDYTSAGNIDTFKSYKEIYEEINNKASDTLAKLDTAAAEMTNALNTNNIECSEEQTKKLLELYDNLREQGRPSGWGSKEDKENYDYYMEQVEKLIGLYTGSNYDTTQIGNISQLISSMEGLYKTRSK